ncbi:MAG: Transcriptional regulator, GntR family [uncultured Rubrobacteraceae bacterium]|uniref:Transcriptional regulator, GntR family n=1 Tax=uncultured Rubrobacteraceae bacterium TaxID=349277 RepID=A0A6J4PCQ6_9ACTN|nr:MAG: Transcriptional regulator, GntR family [uncultured Rubrobacteraceae bacterium]
MTLWLEVDPRGGVPIYVQLVEGVRHALRVGTLRPGERLPTVRGLAEELTVAPNTVVKAYNELQRAGLIESRPGVGTVVVADSGEAVREQQVEALYGRIGVLVRDAVGLGITEDELWERFEREFERVYRRAASGERA